MLATTANRHHGYTARSTRGARTPTAPTSSAAVPSASPILHDVDRLLSHARGPRSRATAFSTARSSSRLLCRSLSSRSVALTLAASTTKLSAHRAQPAAWEASSFDVLANPLVATNRALNSAQSTTTPRRTYAGGPTSATARRAKCGAQHVITPM